MDSFATTPHFKRGLILLLPLVWGCGSGTHLAGGDDADDVPPLDGFDGVQPDAPPEVAADVEPDERSDTESTISTDAEADADGDGVCVPNCSGRECGDDGCGEPCAPGCGGGEACDAGGHCVPTGEPWILVTAGTFQMGSPASEIGRDTNETLHAVTLTHRFLVQSTEVTQSQYQARMGYSPAWYTACGAGCPVETVTWNEAAEYCNELSATAGRVPCYACTGSGSAWTCLPSAAFPSPYDCPGYRLPTEAEWEYAARSDTTTATYNGDLDADHLACEDPNPVLDPIAWFCGNCVDGTHASATREPNGWGLYDMLGNVWEWCHDWFVEDLGPGAAVDPAGPAGGSIRVLRSGHVWASPTDLRAAHRDGHDPSDRFGILGFRPVRSVP